MREQDITRYSASLLREKLENSPAVALLGPRQVGKTTLALGIAPQNARYLDLEDPTDRAKLADATTYLEAQDGLVILDEIQHAPELFPVLRGVIDRRIRRGARTGQFLLLGSASLTLLKQSSETLAGRIDYLELPPITALEYPDILPLWIRGGFPRSLLARSDTASMQWRRAFLKTYRERDIPQFAPRIPAETLRRFWTMLAHGQGGLLNAAQLAGSLGVSGKTVMHYLDLLVDLLLVNRLPPFHSNRGKRLVRSPKIYVRDSGLLHALLEIPTYDALLGNPILGASWEGFVIDNILNIIPEHAVASFYRSSAGAEIDLILEWGGKNGIWAIEIKHGLSPALSRGFHHACEDLKPTRRFVVYSGRERFPLTPNTEAIPLPDLLEEIT